MGNLEDKTYGSYTVLRYSHTTSYGHPIYECQCVCGKIRLVNKYNLKSGHSTSCGCAKRKMLEPGTRFGRWTVVGFAFTKNETAYWNCRCECGKEKPVNGAMLRNGLSQSCGCLQRERFTRFKHGLCGTPEYRRWELKRRRERKRQVDNSWTPKMETVLRTLFGSCVICGMTNSEHQQRWGTSLHVDHIHPLLGGNGLVPGNATILCNICNSSKGHKPFDTLDAKIQTRLNLSADLFKLVWNGIS